MSGHGKMIPLEIEFTGGLEVLFSNKRSHKIDLPATSPDGQPANISFLIQWLCDNLMKDPRKDMFVLDDSVRPGVLVLINDADWELEGEDKYEVEPNDEIVFVSTLHGG